MPVLELWDFFTVSDSQRQKKKHEKVQDFKFESRKDWGKVSHECY